MTMTSRDQQASMKRAHTLGNLQIEIQLTTRTTEDGIPELTRIPEKIATTEHFILLAR